MAKVSNGDPSLTTRRHPELETVSMSSPSLDASAWKWLLDAVPPLRNRHAIRRALAFAALLCTLAILAAAPPATAEDSVPETVRFNSLGGPELAGYLFLPAKSAAPAPAMVLMHGRAGAYSSLADGEYDAAHLSKRHIFWGRFWAARGYAALLVDSFSARGYAHGFPAHSYDERPDAVNEVTVRPLDAYGALAYLRTRREIDSHRIALQGWSNGGSATLATMAEGGLAQSGLSRADGFIGAIAFYPACGLHGKFDSGYRPYAPVRVFSGDDDEEVSAAHCKRLVDASHVAGGDIAIMVYSGATHDFDDPGAKRQSVAANASARADAVARAETFVAALFARKPAP